MHPVQKVLILIGGVAVVVGAVWMAQGAGILPGSFMTGDQRWLGMGLATAAVGVGLIYVALQRPRPNWIRWSGSRPQPKRAAPESAETPPPPERSREEDA